MSERKFCTGCLKDEEKNQTESWCVDCHEPVCRTCAKVHRRLSPPHTIICITNTSNLSPELLNIPRHCTDHPSDKLTFFCCLHDEIVCNTCVASKHNSCRPITLEKAAGGVINGTAMLDLEKRIENLATNIDKMIDDDLNRKSSIQKRIRQIKLQIIEYLNKLEEELLQDVEKKCSQHGTSSTLERSLRIESDLIRKWINNLNSLKEKSSEMHIFQVLKFLDKEVNKKEDDIKQKRSWIVPDVQFMPSEAAKRYKDIFPSIGTINVNMPKTPKPLLRLESQGQTAMNTTRLKLTSSFNISAIAKNGNMISRGCFIPGPRLLLSGIGENYLYICNTDGSGSQKIKLDYTPHHVTLFDRYTALVSSDTDFIQRINIKDLSLGMRIKGSRHCKGISCRDGEIWIMSSHKKLIAVDIDGEVLKELSISFSPWEMCVNQSGDTYCTDNKSELYAITPEGETRVVYSNPDLRNSKGVVIDDRDYIYVGTASNNIHRVSPDGMNNSVILTGKDGIHRLTALAYSRDTKELMVINDYTSVLIFKFV